MFGASSSSAVANVERSVRRRSLSPRIAQEAVFSDSPSLTLRPSYLREEYRPTDRDNALLSTPLLQVEDVDELYCKPTVLLVQNALPTNHRDSDLVNEAIYQQKFFSEEEELGEDSLEAVPLTPRPGISARSETASSCATRISDIPRLPTPDFASPRLGLFDFFRSKPNSKSGEPEISDSFGDTAVDGRTTPVSFMSRTGRQSVLSAISSPLRMIQSLPRPSISVIEEASRLKEYFTTRAPDSQTRTETEIVNEEEKRPLQPRSDSHCTSTTGSSGSATAVSISSSTCSSGRSSLLSEIPTTDKFTRKWPEPKYMQHLKKARHKPDKTQYDKLALGPEAISALSDEEIGLGIERVGQWSWPKWCLALSVLTVFGYSIAALTYSILTWYQTWTHADIMLVADNDVLILITLCSILMLTSALVGLTGTLLNSRPILAVYAILLWPALLSLLTVGYLAYKRAAFALDRKLNLAWSQWYTDIGRQVIQDSLRCCGFYDAVHEAVVTQRCYPRTPLPGCKGPLLRFERDNLTTLWTLAFSFLPLHLINIFVALLCANHVTNTFGKGLMPKKYRLRVEDVRANAHSLLLHFAEGTKPPPIARSGSSYLYNREDKTY